MFSAHCLVMKKWMTYAVRCTRQPWLLVMIAGNSVTVFQETEITQQTFYFCCMALLVLVSL